LRTIEREIDSQIDDEGDLTNDLTSRQADEEMIKRPLHIVSVMATIFAMTVLFADAKMFAQQKASPPNSGAARSPAVKRPEQPVPRQLLDLPPKWVERVQDMSPAEQEKFLANNARFRSLPPARQAQIRRRLDMWNHLTPEQRQGLLDRERTWQQMTPDQKQYVRETLLPRWQVMRPVRRQIILRKLRNLRELDDAERAARLSDETFLSDLSGDEQQMLRDLSNLRGTGLEPPGL